MGLAHCRAHMCERGTHEQWVVRGRVGWVYTTSLRIRHDFHGAPCAGYSSGSEPMDSVVRSACNGLGLIWNPVQDASWHRRAHREGTLVGGAGVERVAISQGVARTCLVCAVQKTL